MPDAGSHIKYGEPQQVLGVPKPHASKPCKKPGDTIEVAVWRDEEVRTLDVPAQFKMLMKGKGLLPFFDKLRYTHRKEYRRWITEAKRKKRD